MSGSGQFVISIDFEKYWGMRDKRSLDSCALGLQNVEQVVDRTLDLFKKHEIRATWSTVGLLFCNNLMELKNKKPLELPNYDIAQLDPYEYVKDLEESTFDVGAHIGVKEIEVLSSSIGQEISTHTFSHLYMLEDGISREAIISDLQLAKQVAAEKGIDIKSIVFPRNQYQTSTLEILKELDIKVYRGNEKSWLYRSSKNQEHGLLRRFFRLVDAFINLSGHNTFVVDKQNDLINIPSSRLLRPFNKQWGMLNRMHIKRIKKGMRHAARNNEVFHLWWHPHNFGSNMNENISRLESILTYRTYLNKKYGFKSKNMSDFISQSA
jgi:polysaccharide deacetylase